MKFPFSPIAAVSPNPFVGRQLRTRVAPALYTALACAALTACGGGGGGSTEGAATASEEVALTEDNDRAVAEAIADAEAREAMVRTSVFVASDGAPACATTVPAIPTPPANAKKVTDFGAIPGDGKDDGPAIQAALDSLKAGEWLVFPPGNYRHGGTLKLARAGTTLYGKGAILHGYNPDYNALKIAADNTRVYSFKLVANTDTRKGTANDAKIALYKVDTKGVRQTLRNVVIQGNTIVNWDKPGTRGANGSSSTGILIVDTQDFLIAQNYVRRTLSDGIHMTGGSKNGRVLNNEVLEGGDDMIASVSYTQGVEPALGSIDKLRQVITNGSGLNSNLFIANNRVHGNYWGRGISVVGGENVTIQNNRVSGVPGRAGVLIARDKNYLTFGVNNVLVQNNTIEKIQNTTPAYNPFGTFKGNRSGQGTVEMYSTIYTDEAALPDIVDALSIKNVLVRNNTLLNSDTGGVRTGTTGYGTDTATDPETGKTVSRDFTPGVVKNIGVFNSTMTSVNFAMNFKPEGTRTDAVHCAGNMFNGVSTNSGLCKTAVPTVTGATVSCTVTGMPAPLDLMAPNS